MEDGLLLNQLQDKIKRSPDLYKKEFEKNFVIFKELINEFKANPAKNDERLDEFMIFFSHVRIYWR